MSNTKLEQRIDGCIQASINALELLMAIYEDDNVTDFVAFLRTLLER